MSYHHHSKGHKEEPTQQRSDPAEEVDASRGKPKEATKKAVVVKVLPDGCHLLSDGSVDTSPVFIARWNAKSQKK